VLHFKLEFSHFKLEFSGYTISPQYNKYLVLSRL